MDFLSLAESRFSCRSFSDKPVEQEKLDKIIKAGMLAPTAVNKQPFKIFEIREDKADKLRMATPFTFDAKEFLLIGADNKIAYTRPFDSKNFAEIDATIVATHIMLAVHDLGLGTTWVGHFDEKILKLHFPEINGYSIIAIFPIGYPSENAEINPMHYQSKSKDEILVEL